MSTRSLAREIAFLALSQMTGKTILDNQSLIKLVTKSLSSLAKSEAKKALKEVEIAGQYFHELSVDQMSVDRDPQAMKNFLQGFQIENLLKRIDRLEVAAHSILETSNLPEIINHQPRVSDYSCQILDKYRENKEDINKNLEQALAMRGNTHDKVWTADRVYSLDRHILKLALTEIIHTDTPQPIIIDEYLRIANKYCHQESPKFINGVLVDAIKLLQL